jgi:hypothetical protein
MANVKDFTGSVSVDSSAKVTPVTRQKIEQVSPDKWHLMDINQLWDQRIILNDRMMKAFQAGHAEIALQVQKGINTIDVLLKHKADEQEQEDEKDKKGSELL